jgi:hypothetical protein
LQIQWVFRMSKFEKNLKKWIIKLLYIDQVSSQKYIRMLKFFSFHILLIAKFG